MTGQPTRPATEDPPGRPHTYGSADVAELVLQDRFSMVPEWVLDADIGDWTRWLYAVLPRYGHTTGARMPSRTTLAGRFHEKSVDTVDRALAELVQLGAVQVETAGLASSASPTGTQSVRPEPAGPTRFLGVAAPTRHDREPSTQTPPPHRPRHPHGCRALT